MAMAYGATSDPTDLVDEAECIVCLHLAENEATVNEDMPSAVRWNLETTLRDGRTSQVSVWDALVPLF